MKLNELKGIFDYNFLAFDRVWQCISQISDEQFVQEIDYSTGSIRNIIVHIMGGNRTWMSVLRGIEIPPRLSFEDYDTYLKRFFSTGREMVTTTEFPREPLKTKAKWDELQLEFLDQLNALDQEQLDVAVSWELLANGLKSVNLRWESFFILPIMPRIIARKFWQYFIITFKPRPLNRI